MEAQGAFQDLMTRLELPLQEPAGAVISAIVEEHDSVSFDLSTFSGGILSISHKEAPWDDSAYPRLSPNVSITLENRKTSI